MSSIMKSKDLINSIRRRAFIPRSQETFTDTDFLEMATEEINIGIMDQLMSSRGDYLVYYIDLPLKTGEDQEYPVPSRAHGNKLRDVSIVSTQGGTTQELSQVSIEELSELNTDGSSYNYFYMKNNAIVLSRVQTAENRMLRMWFYLRPNKLVMNDKGTAISEITDATRVIGGVSTPVKIVQFSFMPKHFTSLLRYDVTEVTSPNKISFYELNPVDIDLTLKTLTFLASDVVGLRVNDIVTQAEETIIPNLPTEYHPIIAQRVAVACLEAMGDEQNKVSAERKLAQMEKSVLRIVSNRVEGAPKKIRQRQGTLNQSISRK